MVDLHDVPAFPDNMFIKLSVAPCLGGLGVHAYDAGAWGFDSHPGDFLNIIPVILD